MILHPRKIEIDAVLGILNSEAFETPEAMAKELIATIAEELGHRTTFGVHAYFPAQPNSGLALGPFYDRREADKVVKDAREAGMGARRARLSATDSIKPPEERSGVCTCGHRLELHPSKADCKVLPTCGCRAYTKREEE